MNWLLPLVFCVTTRAGLATNLGKPFSILHGLKPVIPEANDLNGMFYPVRNKDPFIVIKRKVVTNNMPYFGPDIQLTFHHDQYDLAREFFSMWQFEEKSFNAAAFIYARQNLEKHLAKLFGISQQSMKRKVYVLARYWKSLNTTSIVSTKPGTLRASSIISPNVSSDKIIELFSEQGTHYVSSYELGDMIYQVFVYNKDASRLIQVYPFHDPRYSFGDKSHVFRQFTQLKSVETRGFCHEVGSIMSASGDSALAGIIPHLRDDTYQVPQSILMFLTARKKYELADRLTTAIPIKLLFKPIIDELLPTTSPAKSEWNRIKSIAVFQKFGATSLPHFPPTTVENLVTNIYSSFNPDLVTQTATNYVTITRMTFNLGDFFISNPKFVTHLFIFADVLQISLNTTLRLPGSQKVFLICREFVALSSGNVVPEIILGAHDQSVLTFKIVSEKFRGILKVTQSQSDKHFTFGDDKVYVTVEDTSMANQTTAKTDGKLRLVYPDKETTPEFYLADDKNSFESTWMRKSLTNSAELIVSTAESILAVRSRPEAAETARKSLEWITETLTRSARPGPPLTHDLEMILGRALLITRTRLVEYARTRLIIPHLTFEKYQPFYDRLLNQISAYERTFQVVSKRISKHRQTEKTTATLAELNDNVRRVGKFLVNQAEVNAQNQDDIWKTNKDLHKLEEDRIKREQEKAAQLLNEIIALQKQVIQSRDALVSALTRYKNSQIISTVFNVGTVLGTLFTGGVGMMNIDQKITGIVRVAKKLENVVTIIEQVTKLTQIGATLKHNIGTANRALENIPNSMIDEDCFPTVLDWDDFDNDVNVFTTPGGFLPAFVKGEAAEFKRIALRLSARGRKYVTIAANIASIKYTQIKIEFQRNLAKRQRTRLRSLKISLKRLSHHTAKTTDLFEIGNIIKMLENEVRAELVKTFVKLDAALQYHYFQTPTIITEFDTMSIQRAALEQMLSSLRALQSFSCAPVHLPNPIEYNVSGVPVQDLLSDTGYKVTIPLSAAPFRDYVRVRILRLEVRVDDVIATGNNRVYIQVSSAGDAFEDRDLNRNRRQYSTTPTVFRYVYNIATGHTHVPAGPAEEYTASFVKITPFDDWTFNLPEVSTNECVQFSKNVTTLRLKFYVNVIFNPPHSDRKRGRYARSSIDSVLGSKDRLLTLMNHRSLLRDWDAIMAVNAERVNDIWRRQYESRSNAGFVQRIVTKRSISSETRRRRTEMRLMLDVGPPRIQFIRNNLNRATLKIKITRVVIEWWENFIYGGRSHAFNYNETYKTDANTIIVAHMNLLKLRGRMTNESKIVLDLSDSVFDVPSLPLAPSDLLVARNDILNYFASKLKSEDYELAKVTYETKLTPPSLVPHRFYLATGGFSSSESSGLGTLYIFIKTHSPGAVADHEYKRDFNDPLTIEDQIIPTGYEVALFIHNRIIYEDIIKNDIENYFGFKVHTDIAKDGYISIPQRSKYIVGNRNARHTVTMSIEFDRGRPESFTLEIPGETLTAKSQNKGRHIEVRWVNNDIKVKIPFRKTKCGRVWCSTVTDYKTVKFETNYIKTFTPVIDEKLTITYVVNSKGVGSNSMCAFTAWWLGSEFRRARGKIQKRVRDYMSSLTAFDFSAISAFALTQVVFPNQNVFNFTEVYVPGDMVILGQVKTRATSTNSDSAMIAEYVSNN